MKIEPTRQSLKSELRARIRRQRAVIDPAERGAWNAEIGRLLLEHVEQSSASVIAAFVAFDGEPDLCPALEQLDSDGTQIALPVVRDEPGRAVICFRRWSATSEMQPNRYGIPEPVGTLDVPLSEIDLALIPLVAWDRSGGRLGMGASFYDRLFQPFAEQARPFRMGVAYHLQLVDCLPLDPWDIRLHAVLTERGCFTCPA
jgi:5-formyltetrahydrofolate cyclo-ligase